MAFPSHMINPTFPLVMVAHKETMASKGLDDDDFRLHVDQCATQHDYDKNVKMVRERIKRLKKKLENSQQ